MTLSDIKLFFRTVIKPVPGGPPVGTVGTNRAAGTLAALDQLAEFADDGNLPTVDLLDISPALMNAVLALTYTDCDADPAASPAGSYPGQQFDAINSAGHNCHFYCARGTYDPSAPAGTTGVGPCWHYTLKIG